MYELFDLLLNAQSPCVPSGPGYSDSTCPATAFSAITAAYATQGYWLQADLLHFFRDGGLHYFTMLAYVISAGAGLVSMGMGSPPKMYLWFLMGPAIFHWLISDTLPVHGVRWAVQHDHPTWAAEAEARQEEVWRLAEVGLANSNIAIREDIEISMLDGPLSASPISDSAEPDGTVRVSQLFVFYDSLVSSVVDWMTQWTGVYRVIPANAMVGDTNLPMTTAAFIPYQPHHLVSNLKWSLLEDITSAKALNADIRDAFVTFMGSECGDLFADAIDEGLFVAAANSKGRAIPFSILEDTNAPTYRRVTQSLMNTWIPTPRSIQNLMYSASSGAFRKSLEYFHVENIATGQTAFEEARLNERLRCDQYLYILTLGFRWEAGHIYYQLLQDTPSGMDPRALVYDLFYGWPIRANANDTDAISLNEYQQMDFLMDLILVHLYRNEMALAPQPYNNRLSGSEDVINYSTAYQRSVGQKSKFGEIYTWAMMMPHVQGVLQLLLAPAFVICAGMIVVPGWHKLLFTWMSFWMWTKIMDLGFAMVNSVERSVWSMVGNNSTAQWSFERVLTMQNHLQTRVYCGDTISDPATDPPEALCAAGDIPLVAVGAGGGIDTPPNWYDSMFVLDKALTLGASLDLDLSNSYYIYIMAALYLAVPAVTGQVVLGAKAGAAGMVSNMIGGQSQEAGKAAGSGFTGDMTQRLKLNEAAIGQTAYAKSMRSGEAAGYAKEAINFGNRSLDHEAMAGAANAASSSLGQQSRILFNAYQNKADAAQVGLATMSAGAAVVGSAGNLTSSTASGFPSPRAGGTTTAVPNAARQPTEGPQGGAPISSSTPDVLAGGGGNGGGMGAAGGVAAGAGAVGAAGAAGGRGWGRFAAFTGGNIMKEGPGMMNAFVGMAGPVNNMAINRANRAQQTEFDAKQAGLAVASFDQSGRARGLGNAAGRSNAAAGFAADTSAWEARRDWGTQLSGVTSAMGVFAGTIAPGPKPQGLEGMATTGMLGNGMKNSANWSNPDRGGYFSWFNGMSGDMNSKYGYGATKGFYSESSVGRATQDAVDMTQMHVRGAMPVITSLGSFGAGYNNAMQPGFQGPGAGGSGQPAQGLGLPVGGPADQYMNSRTPTQAVPPAPRFDYRTPTHP